MADTLLLRALKSQPRALNLNCKKLDRVPKIIGKFSCVCDVQLKSNKLKDLPPDFADLVQVLYFHRVSKFASSLLSKR